MTTWLEPINISVPVDILELVRGNPILGQAILRRGIKTGEQLKGFLNPAEYQPASPFDLPGMAQAVERIYTAIGRGETICIWGDFDVDGQTATALLVSVLGDLGARVIFHIPVRSVESHGVTWPILEKILGGDQDFADGWLDYFLPVSLVITCDTGISANFALEMAQKQGVDVIITDHHELPEQLPRVLAIINPRLLPTDHALSTLPGVGVAYELGAALCCSGEHRLDLDDCLDLVALGVVADVATQAADTRYLLQRGLQRLRSSPRLGILAILEQADISPGQVNEELISYEIGPRLNALGRLGDANPAVKLLTTTEMGEARLLAIQLEIMNNQRRLLTSQVFQGALAQIDQNPRWLDQSILVLAHPDWPAGILGIVASRMVDRFHKPVVMIAAPQPGPARASARSIEGVNITAALSANSQLLLNYGGHAMAAGFSIDPSLIDELRRALDRTIQQQSPRNEKSVEIDAIVELSQVTLELVEDFEMLAPFGAGNPPLVLAANDLGLTSITKVGKGGEHLALVVADRHGNSLPVMFWQGDGCLLPEERFDLAFSARTTTFKGNPGLQVEWIDFRRREDLSKIPIAAYRPVFEDYRSESFPLGALQKLLKKGDLQVWAEAEAINELKGHGIYAAAREDLIASKALAVWTPPPSSDVFAKILRRIRPEQIYLFAVNPQSTDFDRAIRRLAGLVKYLLEQNAGIFRLEKLAGGLALDELTTRSGLEWLAATGEIILVETSPGEFIVSREGKRNLETAQYLAERIAALLTETLAYRTAYVRIPLSNFMGLVSE